MSLHWIEVAKGGLVDSLRSMIAAGFNVNTIENTCRKTHLQIAIRYATEDLPEYVTILLGAGASINFPYSTPLLDLICRYTGDKNITDISLTVARKLIEAGCDVNQLTTISTIEMHGYSIVRTPLMQAIECNFLEFANFLLDHGADPNIKCNLYTDCYAPLHLAAMHQNLPAAELLISANADLHVLSTPIPGTDSEKYIPSRTPLGIICWNKNPSVPFAKMLLAADSNAEKGLLFARPLLCAPIMSSLDELRSASSTLKRQTLNAVRRVLRGPYFRRKINALELPRTLVHDLKNNYNNKY